MQLNKNIRILLNQFLKKKILTISEIQDILNLKQRSCYLYIEQLNDWLKELKLKPIDRDKNLNYVFAEEVKIIEEILDKDNIYYYSNNERQDIIIFLLLIYKTISIKELKRILNVSEITIRNDVTEVSKIYKGVFDLSFQKNNIQIKKINEINKRSILCQTIKSSNKYINDFLNKIDSKLFLLLLNLLEEKCLITISNYLKDLIINFLKAIYLSLFINSVSLDGINSYNEENSKIIFKDCKTFSEIEEHFNEFFSQEKFKDIFSNFKECKSTALFEKENVKDEFNYFCYFILSGNISWKIKKMKMDNYEKISSSIEKLLEKFEQETFVYLNNKNMVIEDLSKHIACAYHREKIKFTFLLENIPNFIVKYNNYFLAIKKNIYIVEELLDVKFQDIEIYYILLHLISNIVIEKVATVNIAIDCNDINSVYKFLYNELNNQIKNCNFFDLKIIHSLKNIDLILTTNSSKNIYENSNIEVLYINKFLVSHDIEIIKEKVKEIIGKKESTKDINNFYEIDNDASINNVISILSSQFLNNFIDETYINNVYKRLENNMNTVKVKDNIVVLHANLNEGVIKNGYCISVGIVKGKGFYSYKNEKIKIFIFVVPDLFLQHIENVSNLITVCSNIDLNLDSKIILKEIQSKWKTL